jgi:hypothetical protein
VGGFGAFFVVHIGRCATSASTSSSSTSPSLAAHSSATATVLRGSRAPIRTVMPSSAGCLPGQAGAGRADQAGAIVLVMASLQTLERRILALEARLADVEGGYGDTLYKLHRASIKADLRTAKILERLEIEDVTDDEVDAVLDQG